MPSFCSLGFRIFIRAGGQPCSPELQKWTIPAAGMVSESSGTLYVLLQPWQRSPEYMTNPKMVVLNSCKVENIGGSYRSSGPYYYKNEEIR